MNCKLHKGGERMISIKVNLLHVDYDNMVERFLPEVFKNVTEESKFSMKVANELLVKNKFTNRIAKGIVKIVPKNTKDKIAMDILRDNKVNIETQLNQWFMDNRVGLRIMDLQVKDFSQEGSDCIKIEVNLEEIDYSSLVKGLLPKILQSMSEKDDKQGSLGKILVDMKEAPGQMIEAALDVLPQSDKDELITKIFGVYKDDIIDIINQKITEQQITAVVSDVGVNVTK